MVSNLTSPDTSALKVPKYSVAQPNDEEVSSPTMKAKVGKTGSVVLSSPPMMESLEEKSGSSVDGSLPQEQPIKGLGMMKQREEVEVEVDIRRKFDHFVTDDRRISSLKQQERSLNNKDRSRNIERRRRLLTEEQGKREGPPVDDPPNIYDYYAVRVQTCIRGFLVRCWMRW